MHKVARSTRLPRPCLDAVQVELGEVREGVLVHGIDLGQVCHHEEEEGPTHRHRAVLVARGIDAALCVLCLGDAAGQGQCGDLARLEGIDQRLVVQHVATRGLEKRQDALLQVPQLPRVVGDAHGQPVLAILELRPLAPAERRGGGRVAAWGDDGDDAR